MRNREWLGDALEVKLEPSFAEVDSTLSVNITVKVIQDDLPVGTGILCSLLGPHAWPQLIGPEARGDLTDLCPVSAEFPSDIAGHVQVDNRALRRAVILRTESGQIRLGDCIRIRLGDDRAAVHLPQFDCRIPLAVFLLPPDAKPVEIDGTPSFHIMPGPATQIRLLVASRAVLGSPTWIHARLVDCFGNTSSNFKGALRFKTTDPQAKCIQTVQFTNEHQGMIRIPDGVTWNTPAIQRLSAHDVISGLSASSNPVEAVASIDGTPLLAWGDFHGHTSLSDGLEGPDFYYRYARNVEALDFSGISDHSHGHQEAWEDDGELRDDSSDLAFRKAFPPSEYPHWPSRLTRWALTKRAAKEHNDPDRFVAFLGYEWNLGKIEEPNFGAKCIYFPGDSGPMLTYFDEEGADPYRLWETLRPSGAITIPHHTAYPLNGLPPGVDWRYHDEVMQPVVEIYSKHGTSEYYGNPRPTHKVQKGNFVQDALARGHRIGFIAGSDSHLARPGSDCMEYEKGYYRQGGLAAVYTETLTRRGILDALRARRCYGTTNGRIILRFDVDGHQMGEIWTATSSEYDSREVHVFVAGTAPLKVVEVICNNEAVYSWHPGGLDGRFSWSDKRRLDHPMYYYARIVQADEEMAWSSPVWIDLPREQ